MKILSTNSGNLACGEIGYGRMMEPQQILELIQPILNKTDFPSLIITSGGTKEPVDAVRFISNISSGKTGAKLADYFIQNNWKVTYMSSQDAEKPFGKCNKLEFSSSKDLEKMLIKHLSKNHYDSIIHMAAVSDFAPKFVTTTKKLSSKSKKLILEMEQTPKIVNNIKKESKNKDIRLVAFKLTSNEKQSSILKKVNDIFSNADADLIVHNDLSTRVNGIQSSFHIYDENGFISSVKDAKDLGRSVEPKLRKVLV